MRHLMSTVVVVITFIVLSGCNDTQVLKKITVSEVDLPAVADGTYHGNYKIELPAGYFIGQPSAAVDVTVSNHRYESIQLIGIPAWMISNKDMKITPMLNQILFEQKLNVDSASGASYTKKAIQKAIENAFSNNLIK